MRPAITIAAAGLSLAMLATSPVVAATAHNSQAGSWGPRSNDCEATPYFPPDTGCLGAAIQRYQDDEDLPLPRGARSRYRPRPPLD